MSAKDLKGKLPIRLLPKEVIEQFIYVRQFGCDKYGDTVGDSYKDVKTIEFVEAMIRHGIKWLAGERLDSEIKDGKEVGSGLNHLAHALCSAGLAIMNEEKDYVTSLDEANGLRHLANHSGSTINKVHGENIMLRDTIFLDADDEIHCVYNDDDEWFQSIKNGMEDSINGRYMYTGSFNKYLDDCSECTDDDVSDFCKQCISERVKKVWEETDGDTVCS